MDVYNNSKVFDVFYDMLKMIRESGRRNPEAASTVVRDGEQYEQMSNLQNMEIPFSGEECFGQYVDLHEFYNRYINSKFGHPINYVVFLDSFPTIDMIPSKYKATAQYKDYMEGVLAYLVSFLDRTKPLMFLDRVFKIVESEFEARWTVERGKKRPRTTTTVDDVIEQFDAYDTVESLIEIKDNSHKPKLTEI
ncbi:splicing factor SF3a60 homolog [Chenopodium quinoa]|uniref:splicing factor SF3a60 homolog n=1 Tax=Chenopodium quinoa TaxID=63459 RepID=UPI000B78BC82|nr:splicing factor SF3a60 homolog [Chenopodium quinoa]